MLLCFTSLTAQDRRYLSQAHSFIKAKRAGTLGFESISQALKWAQKSCVKANFREVLKTEKQNSPLTCPPYRLFTTNKGIMCCQIYGSQERSDLRHSEMEEFWDKQDSSEQSEETVLAHRQEINSNT